MPVTEHLLTAIRLLLILAGISLLGLAYWVRATEEGTAIRPFVALLALVGVFAIGDGIVAPRTQGLALVWAFAYMLIPVAFAAFVVEYYGLPYLATRGQRVAFLAPVVVGIAGSAFIVLSPSMATPSVMAGGVTTAAPSYPSIINEAASLADSIGIFYAGGLMLAAMGLLFRTCRRYAHLDTRLGAALSFVGLWPWVSYLSHTVIFDFLTLQTILASTAGAYVLSALAAGFVVSTGRLFEATPAAGTLGPETVLADLADPVFVVDRDDRIVRLNEQAATTFGTTIEASIGEPFESVVGETIDAFDEQGCLELPVENGARHFEGTVAKVEDRHGRTPGRAIVVRDVTQRRLRGQRLTVLNRVLRHNLRNRMSSIIGRAELLADGGVERDDVAEDILTAADDLVTLGERAREVEEMMAVSPQQETEAGVNLVVRSIVEEVGATYPEVGIRTNVDEDLTVPVDPRILEPVLHNVVENAAEHNDAVTPEVSVEATVDDDRPEFVRLTVGDNGPGIPDAERAVIRDAEESPLEHGSGLGLWAVSWGVTRIGGDLSIEGNSPRGTRVTIWIPRQTGSIGTTSLGAASATAD